MEGRTIIKWGLVGLLSASIVGYSCFVLYDYFRGPRIIISGPQSGISTTSPLITITGQVVHVSTLFVNDTQTPSDLNGYFQSRLILGEGYNIMKVTAKDRYDRTVEKTIEITLLPQPHSSSTATTTKDIN